MESGSLENLGMVFQIIDDLDFSGDLQTMGKSPMTDFETGYYSAYVYALKQPDFRMKSQIVDRRNLPGGADHVRKGTSKRGLDYSKALAILYRRAINNLKVCLKYRQGFSQSPGKLQERQY